MSQKTPNSSQIDTHGEINTKIIRKRIRVLIYFFIFALVISGITAIPLRFEITVLNKLLGNGSSFSRIWPSMSVWITFVHEGILETYRNYPFMLYGTDWLAFAHIVIGISFIGPLRDPVRNIWVIEFAMIACILILPTTLIFGPVRGIPLFWTLIDCSFGVFGIIPLWIIRKDIQALSAFGG